MYSSCLALQSDPSIARLARDTDRRLLQVRLMHNAGTRALVTHSTLFALHQPFSVEFLQHISSIVRRALPS